MFVDSEWKHDRICLTSQRNQFCHSIASKTLSGLLLDSMVHTSKISAAESGDDDESKKEEERGNDNCTDEAAAMEEDDCNDRNESTSRKHPAPVCITFDIPTDDCSPKTCAAGNSTKQVLLCVPQTNANVSQTNFQKNMQQTEFITLLCISLMLVEQLRLPLVHGTLPWSPGSHLLAQCSC